jgi:hypothetical protein
LWWQEWGTKPREREREGEREREKSIILRFASKTTTPPASEKFKHTKKYLTLVTHA